MLSVRDKNHDTMKFTIETSEDVQRALARIKAEADDDERAHGMEDDLRDAVLRAIADGTGLDEPEELAREVLKSSEIKFARWCA